LILAERDRHRNWGPRKLLAVLSRDMPDVEARPAASAVYDILTRNGRIQSVRRPRKQEHPGKSGGSTPPSSSPSHWRDSTLDSKKGATASGPSTSQECSSGGLTNALGL
jgi:hypothetical protein